MEFKLSDLIAKKRREESLKHTNLASTPPARRRGESPPCLISLIFSPRCVNCACSTFRRAACSSASHRSLDFFFASAYCFRDRRWTNLAKLSHHGSRFERNNHRQIITNFAICVFTLHDNSTADNQSKIRWFHFEPVFSRAC